MNDYFLTILIRQRHEEILAAVRASQHLGLGLSRAAWRNTSIRRFLMRRKSNLEFQVPEAAERKAL